MAQSSRIEARIRALSLARDCAQLGARVRTIQQLSGVHPSEIVRLMFSKRHPPPCGRPPDTREWYHRTSLLERTQASVIAATFMRQRAGGFPAAESLIDTYHCYRGLFGPHCHISFDRAFDLASHTAGLWIAQAQSFQIASCPRCGCDFLDALGASRSRSCDRNCPFCAQLQRRPRPPGLLDTAPAAARQAGSHGN